MMSQTWLNGKKNVNFEAQSMDVLKTKISGPIFEIFYKNILNTLF